MKTLIRSLVLLLLFTGLARADGPRPHSKGLMIAGAVITAAAGLGLVIAAGLAIHDDVARDPARPTMGSALMWIPLAAASGGALLIGAPMVTVGAVRYQREQRPQQLSEVESLPVSIRF